MSRSQIARTSAMDNYIELLFDENLAGIPLWAWQRFLALFTESRTVDDVRHGLDALADWVATEAPSAETQALLLEKFREIGEIIAGDAWQRSCLNHAVFVPTKRLTDVPGFWPACAMALKSFELLMEDFRRRTDDYFHAEMLKLNPRMLVAAALRKERVESNGRHWTGNRPLPGKRTALFGVLTPCISGSHPARRKVLPIFLVRRDAAD